MREHMAKMVMVISIAALLVVSSGCGSKGDLYHPDEPQSTAG